ncbi:MAG: hypothetical protein AMS26_11780 [Bacteroides sp. SM23_62]|nr:MAG: hypothetical protein AMS26_11780 [Bacteroides sp. SM23_62]
MKDKRNVQVFIMISLMAVLACMHACSTTDKPGIMPNIIFILADDMAFHTPGCYGGSTIHTPNIDSLARQGMLFSQAYSGCSVCAPARASLMTGLHTGHTSVRGNTGGIALPDRDTTFAEILQSAGYTVGGFGKWGLGDVGTEGVAEKHGFDVFFGYYHQIHAHFYYTDYLWKNSRKVEMLNAHGDSASYTHYRIIREMKQFIRDNRSGPFFCFGSFTLPHSDDDGNPQIPGSDPAYLHYSDKQWTERQKKFAAMNTRVDYDLGEIINLLVDLNIDRNTIVIFSSDNGGGRGNNLHFNDSGQLRGSKHTFYEGGIKVPLIFYWPGRIEPGSTSDLPCYFADMMPTLLDLAGIKDMVPHGIDGISLVPSLLGEGLQETHDYMYWELPAYDWTNLVYPGNWLQQAIRMGDWKLLRHDTAAAWELYNLAMDPGESTDLASEEPDIVKELIDQINMNRTEMPDQIEPEMPEGKWYR